MGLLDRLRKKLETQYETHEHNEKEKARICAVCQGDGADKKWGGMTLHKACYRKVKKAAAKYY